MAFAARTKVGSSEISIAIEAGPSFVRTGFCIVSVNGWLRYCTCHQGRLGAFWAALNHSHVRFNPSSNPNRGRYPSAS